MNSLLIFLIGAIVSAAVLVVSGVELVLSVQRRKKIEALTQQITEIKAQYTAELNKLTLKEDEVLDAKEDEIEALKDELKEETGNLEEKYKDKLDAANKKAKHALEKAKAEVSKIEGKAKAEAEAYMEKRKAEVEEELVDLVMNVSRKVLPKGISYEAQKDLVMQALRDATANSKQ